MDTSLGRCCTNVNMDGETVEERHGAPTDVQDLISCARRHWEQYESGAHDMCAYALKAIDACSADAPQMTQLVALLAHHATDRDSSKAFLENLQRSLQDHLRACQESEQKQMQNTWGPQGAQQHKEVRVQTAALLQHLRLQRQQIVEALLWLELMAASSGPPTI